MPRHIVPQRWWSIRRRSISATALDIMGAAGTGVDTLAIMGMAGTIAAGTIAAGATPEVGADKR